MCSFAEESRPPPLVDHGLIQNPKGRFQNLISERFEVGFSVANRKPRILLGVEKSDEPLVFDQADR
jgi:hypothetical protein